MPRSLPQPDNRVYLGAGGSGKSTLALKHAAAFPRVLYVRPDESERPPYPNTDDRRRLIEAMLKPAWRVSYTVHLQLEEMEWANEAAWHAGDCVVLWEEAGVTLPQRQLKVAAPFAFSLWMRGRHHRCRVFATSQRPGSLAADLRANVKRAVIFNMTEPDDVDWACRVIGGGRERAAEIASLPLGTETGEFRALDWHRGAGAGIKDAPFP